MAENGPPTPSSDSPANEAWFTVEQAAEYLKVSKAAVYRAVKRGDIPARRVGRFLRIPVSAIAPGAVVLNDELKREVIIAAISKAFQNVASDGLSIGEQLKQSMREAAEEILLQRVEESRQRWKAEVYDRLERGELEAELEQQPEDPRDLMPPP